MFQEASETCGICGGDGRIGNSFGDTKTCPGCHGSGRRSEDSGFRDVTKTKPSHYKQNTAAKATPAEKAKPSWPLTGDGSKLAGEVRDSKLSEDIKTKLIREIVEYEQSHGSVTKTFSKKVRKQVAGTSAG